MNQKYCDYRRCKNYKLRNGNMCCVHTKMINKITSRYQSYLFTFNILLVLFCIYISFNNTNIRKFSWLEDTVYKNFTLQKDHLLFWQKIDEYFTWKNIDEYFTWQKIDEYFTWQMFDEYFSWQMFDEYFTWKNIDEYFSWQMFDRYKTSILDVYISFISGFQYLEYRHLFIQS